MNPSSFSLARGYICWGYTNFKATEDSSFECQLCSVVFSGERALRSPRKLDYLCERVEKKNTGYGFTEGATSPFGTVRFELGSGSAAGLFAWRAALSNEDICDRFTSHVQREAGGTPVLLCQ